MNKKGQNLTEYVILFSIVVAVFVGMQIYIKRGIQGTIKLTADDLGKQEGVILDPQRGYLLYSKSKLWSESRELDNRSGQSQHIYLNQTEKKDSPEDNYSIYIGGFKPERIINETK